MIDCKVVSLNITSNQKIKTQKLKSRCVHFTLIFQKMSDINWESTKEEVKIWLVNRGYSENLIRILADWNGRGLLSADLDLLKVASFDGCTEVVALYADLKGLKQQKGYCKEYLR